MMVLHFGLTAFFGTPVVSRRGTLFYLIWHEPLPHPHSLVTQSLHQIKTFDLSFSSPDHVNVRFCSFFCFLLDAYSVVCVAVFQGKKCVF